MRDKSNSPSRRKRQYRQPFATHVSRNVSSGRGRMHRMLYVVAESRKPQQVARAAEYVKTRVWTAVTCRTGQSGTLTASRGVGLDAKIWADECTSPELPPHVPRPQSLRNQAAAWA
jgi:hypothetical protein